MAKFQANVAFGRRDVFGLAATAGLGLLAESYAFGASDFWNKKKASEWTDQEKEELRTKSPWAKKADPESSGGRAGGSGGAGGEAGADSGGGGGRGGGGGGGGRGGRGGGGVAPAGNFGGGAPLSIVWESAKPIQEAHPLKLPDKLDNHYILAVTGIPQQVLNAAIRGGGGGRRGGGQDAAAGGDPPGAPAAPADPTAGLKRGATLTVKGKAPQNADIVLAMNNNATVLFSFAKDALAIALADKEVEFTLKLGSLSAKTKFTLKDMTYGDELAI